MWKLFLSGSPHILCPGKETRRGKKHVWWILQFMFFIGLLSFYFEGAVWSTATKQQKTLPKLYEIIWGSHSLIFQMLSSTFLLNAQIIINLQESINSYSHRCITTFNWSTTTSPSKGMVLPFLIWNFDSQNSELTRQTLCMASRSLRKDERCAQKQRQKRLPMYFACAPLS